MSEHHEDQDRVYAATPDEAGAEPDGVEPGQRPVPESTGHAGVDDVLRSLDGIDGRPVDEHVVLFEAAHETLRAALADAGDGPGGQAGS